MRQFPSRQQACDARRDYMERRGHLTKRIIGGAPWYDWERRGWVDHSCRVYDAPNGRLRPNKKFGIECVAGEPCPDPTPPPAETPVPTPPPSTDCADGPNGVTLDFFCSTNRDCVPGGTAKNPNLALRDAPQNGFWSASFYCNQPGDKIHAEDPRYPGAIPTFSDGHVEGHDGTGWFVQDPGGTVIVSGKDHRGAALAEAVIHHGARTSWQQRVISGDRIDCSWAFSDGHNIRCNDHDFRTHNSFWLDYYMPDGKLLRGSATVTVR